jgi:glycerol-3-phosphate dehydrogenase subunit B
MNLETDLLIIGGGMAGLVAGIVAAEAGLNTILLQKGQSATAFSSGAIDVIGYLPAASEPFSTPEEGLTAIAGLYPLHPYGIVGYGDDVKPEDVVGSIVRSVQDALEWLKHHLEETMSPVMGTFDSNMYPITILGTTKPTCLVQKTMNSDDLQERDDSVLLFAGITGYPDFNPSTAAKTYLEDRIAMGQPPHKVGHCMLQISPFGKSFNVSSIEIARHLDHEGSVDALARQLKKQVKQIGPTHVAVPPILGIRNALENKSTLEKLLGVKVFELLSFPPSVPGFRLQKALETVYTKSGGKLLVGHEAISSVKAKRRVKSVIARSPRRQITIDAKAFLIATGKYIGGGIAGDERGLRETVFNIMTVTGDYHAASEIIPSRYTHRLSINPTGQPIQSCGLSVDPQFRPVDEDGIEWADNLFAAGAVLAGYNYSVEKSGLGVALTSGYSAALKAMEFIKEVTLVG